MSAAAVARAPTRIDAATLLLLVLPPMLWAGNAVVGRMLVGSVAPLTLNLLRWTMAFVFLAPFVFGAKTRPRMADWRAASQSMVWIGLLGVGAYNSLQYLALQTSTPVSATLIGASAPVMTLALGAVFFRATVRPLQWFGAAVSIAGVIVVLTRGDPQRLSALRFVVGDLFMLAATASWSLYTWLLRRHRPDLPPLQFMALQIVWGSAWCVPLVAVEASFGVPIHPSWQVALALLYIGTAPSLIAYLCWDRGVARTGAALPTFFANLTPLFAALLSALLLGETPQGYHLLAFALIAAGIGISMRR